MKTLFEADVIIEANITRTYLFFEISKPAVLTVPYPALLYVPNKNNVKDMIKLSKFLNNDNLRKHINYKYNTEKIKYEILNAEDILINEVEVGSISIGELMNRMPAEDFLEYISDLDKRNNFFTHEDSK